MFSEWYIGSHVKSTMDKVMVEAQICGTALLVLVYDNRPSNHPNSFALSWDCFGKLLPLWTEFLIVPLVIS